MLGRAVHKELNEALVLGGQLREGGEDRVGHAASRHLNDQVRDRSGFSVGFGGHSLREEVGCGVGLDGAFGACSVCQRWVIAIETKIQLPNTLPIILNCAIGIID